MEKSLEERISELEKNQFIQKNVLSFDEASKFLNLSKSYLYKLTSGGQIPHYKPQGKILYFDKKELETSWDNLDYSSTSIWNIRHGVKCKW